MPDRGDDDPNGGGEPEAIGGVADRGEHGGVDVAQAIGFPDHRHARPVPRSARPRRLAGSGAGPAQEGPAEAVALDVGEGFAARVADGGPVGTAPGDRQGSVLALGHEDSIRAVCGIGGVQAAAVDPKEAVRPEPAIGGDVLHGVDVVVRSGPAIHPQLADSQGSGDKREAGMAQARRSPALRHRDRDHAPISRSGRGTRLRTRGAPSVTTAVALTPTVKTP